MSTHLATIFWENTGSDFLSRRYPREHIWRFDGGIEITASPSPHIVSGPWSNATHIDPEEAIVASVASWHMLWFLHVACDKGFTMASYADAAEGIMRPNERGVPRISRITLHPVITWDGETKPTADEQCFIAASIKTEVIIQSP